MANEIKMRITLDVSKGFLTRKLDSTSLSMDLTGTVVQGPVDLALTTSYAAISKGSVGTPRWMWIRNTHATVSCTVSMDDGVTDDFTLLAGEAMVAPLNSAKNPATIKIKSITNPGKVEYAIVEA